MVGKNTEERTGESESEWLTEGLGLPSLQTTTAQGSPRIYSFQGENISPQNIELYFLLTQYYIFLLQNSHSRQYFFKSFEYLI